MGNTIKKLTNLIDDVHPGSHIVINNITNRFGDVFYGNELRYMIYRAIMFIDKNFTVTNYDNGSLLVKCISSKTHSTSYACKNSESEMEAALQSLLISEQQPCSYRSKSKSKNNGLCISIAYAR